MPTTIFPNIELSSAGVPFLAGTRTKVIEIVLDRLAHHWDADEIQRQHSHLSLSQIYSALAYYYDHQAELDQEIESEVRDVERMKTLLGGIPASP